MHRLERLINLVAALLETDRPLSAEELRRRLPGYAADLTAFRRAFERDKETLRELGVPVATEPLDPAHPGIVGYRIRKDEYYLRDPELEPDELAALHLAASTVRLEAGAGDGGAPALAADGIAALWKLGGEVIEEGPVGTLASLPAPPALAVTFAAVASRRRLRFAYRGRERRIDPYRLTFRSGRWYLLGHDHGRGEPRWYRLDRFESEAAADGPPGAFGRPEAVAEPPVPWAMGGGQKVRARLLVDADQAGWALGHLGSDAVDERRPDGSVVVAVPVTNRDAFRSFVLGFLTRAEVLGPPDVRDEMVSWLEALAAGPGEAPCPT